MDFSPYTLQCLIDAGWREGRIVDPSPYLLEVEKMGYPVFPNLERFLSQFGGLVVRYQKKPLPLLPHRPDELRLIPQLAPNMSADDYPVLIRKTLAPIGDAFRRHANLMMSVDGSVYAGVDEHIVELGRSGEEAIETLCMDHPKCRMQP